MAEAKEFAEAIHAQYPGKLLAYNCSPSFNWKRHLSDVQIASFQKELGAMGYKYQFVTLAGFHSLNFGMFELAQVRAGVSKSFGGPSILSKVYLRNSLATASLSEASVLSGLCAEDSYMQQLDACSKW